MEQVPSTELIDRFMRFELTDEEREYIGLQGVGFMYRSIQWARERSSTGDFHRLVKDHFQQLSSNSST